jgi:hypothetical protein
MRTFAPQRKFASQYCNVPANHACAYGHGKPLKVKAHRENAKRKPFHRQFPRHDLDVSVKPSP